MIGVNKKSHFGIGTRLPDFTSMETLGSEKTYRVPPRALTSSKLETSFSAISLSGANAITGIFSSISAKGPCLSSPAG